MKQPGFFALVVAVALSLPACSSIADDEGQVFECTGTGVTCDGASAPMDPVTGCGTQEELDNGSMSRGIADGMRAGGCSEVGGDVTCTPTGQRCTVAPNNSLTGDPDTRRTSADPSDSEPFLLCYDDGTSLCACESKDGSRSRAEEEELTKANADQGSLVHFVDSCQDWCCTAILFGETWSCMCASEALLDEQGYEGESCADLAESNWGMETGYPSEVVGSCSELEARL